MLDQNFDFRPKYIFSTKIYIFDQNIFSIAIKIVISIDKSPPEKARDRMRIRSTIRDFGHASIGVSERENDTLFHVDFIHESARRAFLSQGSMILESFSPPIEVSIRNKFDPIEAHRKQRNETDRNKLGHLLQAKLTPDIFNDIIRKSSENIDGLVDESQTDLVTGLYQALKDVEIDPNDFDPNFEIPEIPPVTFDPEMAKLAHPNAPNFDEKCQRAMMKIFLSPPPAANNNNVTDLNRDIFRNRKTQIFKK